MNRCFLKCLGDANHCIWPLWVFSSKNDKRKTLWDIACVVIVCQHFLSSRSCCMMQSAFRQLLAEDWSSDRDNDIVSHGNSYKVGDAFIAGSVVQSLHSSSNWIITTTLWVVVTYVSTVWQMGTLRHGAACVGHSHLGGKGRARSLWLQAQALSCGLRLPHGCPVLNQHALLQWTLGVLWYSACLLPFPSAFAGWIWISVDCSDVIVAC